MFVKRFFKPIALAAFVCAVLLSVPAIPASAHASDWTTYGDWHVRGSAATKTAEAWAYGSNGYTRLHISCDASTGRGFFHSVDQYSGELLKRENFATVIIKYVLHRQDGSTKDYSSGLQYIADEAAWIGNKKLSGVFINEFGNYLQLTVLNAQGYIVEEFSLKGSLKSRNTMRTYCGF
ncbi:MAG: hypothetical protein ACPGO3_06890 [Magnetospiraceae bacterium]